MKIDWLRANNLLFLWVDRDVVAWFVRAFGNNIDHLQTEVQIPLKTHDLYGAVTAIIN